MKLRVDVLQPLKLAALSVSAWVMLSGCGAAGGGETLYRQAEELAAEKGGAGSFEVALSDFTDFDWDKAVVFKHPASGREIEEAVGVQYQGPLDLTFGVFFVKDGEIVYEELFVKDFETRPPFMIYPHSGDNVGGAPHVGVFAPDSVFLCSITESDADNGTCYSLKPADSPADHPVSIVGQDGAA